jgi:hypothetical protein
MIHTALLSAEPCLPAFFFLPLPCALCRSLLVMGFDLVGPDLVFGGLTALYVTSGIISIRDGAAGFSNTGVLTVLVLYLVAEGVSQTGGERFMGARMEGAVCCELLRRDGRHCGTY